MRGQKRRKRLLSPPETGPVSITSPDPPVRTGAWGRQGENGGGFLLEPPSWAHWGPTLLHRHHFRVPQTLVFCSSHLLRLRGYPTSWGCIAHTPLPSPSGILCQSAEGRGPAVRPQCGRPMGCLKSPLSPRALSRSPRLQPSPPPWDWGSPLLVSTYASLQAPFFSGGSGHHLKSWFEIFQC